MNLNPVTLVEHVTQNIVRPQTEVGPSLVTHPSLLTVKMEKCLTVGIAALEIAEGRAQVSGSNGGRERPFTANS